MRARTRLTSLPVAIIAVGALTVTAVGSGTAMAATAQASIVAAVPMAGTPNINDGQTLGIAQVGTRIVLGGTFTNVSPAGVTDGSQAVPRTEALAFDATTGKLDTGFVPSLDGAVWQVTPGPVADTVYLAGAFTTVDGVKSKSLALVSTITGARVPGFTAPTMDGIAYTVKLSGGHLFVGGDFSKVAGVAHSGIVTLNPTTGALDPYLDVQLTGHHNDSGSGAIGGVGARKMAVSPDGSRLIVIGNFKDANGTLHDQIVNILIGSKPAATIDPNWNTQEYTALCFSDAFDTYMQDVDFAPDGSYFVVAATGGSGTNNDGSNSLCDSASRWETSATGDNVQPTWADYSGQDTIASVAVTGSAVYVGGHQRWLNNPDGYDYAGPGAVPRPGLGALDPVSGVPMSWNPGRNPRGSGAAALLATSTGLWVGSDTQYIGNRKYYRGRIAFFPLAGGTPTPSVATTALPANVYLAGQLTSTASTNVLYRVNAGGSTIQAIDGGPDWQGDPTDGSPYHNGDSQTAGYGPVATIASTVPATTPSGIFSSERWDPGSNGDGDEMQWTFPATVGEHVQVRLYFANRYDGTSGVGQRVFDVAVDGTTVLNHYDIVADVGDQTGTMKAFNVTVPATGQVSIDWTHETENPLVNGIELINQDAPVPPPPPAGSLLERAFNGTAAGPTSTVGGTGTAWSSVRGAFTVGGTLFYGMTDGNLYRRSFDGTTFGPATKVDPYDDPAWVNVQTGSGQTYQGAAPGFYGGEIQDATSMFYSGGKIYYTMLGDSELFARSFNPDSGIVTEDESSTDGVDLSNIAGAFLSGSSLYYASRADGNLHRVAFADGSTDPATDTVVSGPALDGNDWRTRGLFLGKAAVVPPTAAFTSTCTAMSCSFNASTSTGATAYSWAFGDGTTGTGVAPTHRYTAAGAHTVTLTVTGTGAQTATASHSVSPAPPAATYTAVTPCRVYDTRGATAGCPGGSASSKAPVGPAGVLAVKVTGVGGVPAGATAVVLNVTAVNATSRSTYITAWPAGQPKPTASNLNVSSPAPVANLVVVPVGTGGVVNLGNATGNVDLLADLQGYYATGTGSGYSAVAPCRVFDTRGTVGSCSTPPAATRETLGAGQTLTVKIAGVGGVPATATAVVLNLTAVGATRSTYETVFPGGTARPVVSNLSVGSAAPLPNLVVVQLAANGTVSFYNNAGSVDLLADLAGYFAPTSASGYTATGPCRILDTRGTTGTCPGAPAGVDQSIGSGQVRTFHVAGVGSVPASVTAVVLNVTAVNASRATYLTVFPGGTVKPVVSNLNVSSASPVANLVTVPVSADGTVSIGNYIGDVDAVVDLAGYYSAS